MNEKGNAPGDEPRAKNENSAEDVIFYANCNIFGQAGEIGRTPDHEAAAYLCDLKARYWETRGELAMLETALEIYGETPDIPNHNGQTYTTDDPGELTPKEEKLRHYANRDLMPFLQFEGLYLPDGGNDMYLDDDWDWVTCCNTSELTSELMSGNPGVRVLITPDTSQKDALRLLKKIKTWIKKDGLKHAANSGPYTEISDEKIPF